MAPGWVLFLTAYAKDSITAHDTFAISYGTVCETHFIRDGYLSGTKICSDQIDGRFLLNIFHKILKFLEGHEKKIVCHL